MHVLIFTLGNDRYGLCTAAISRVLPLLDCKAIPHAPDYVAGLMNFHGTSIPVIDMPRLSYGRAFTACFDSRIILVDYPIRDRQTAPLGLIAEHVLGLEMIDDALLAPSGIATPAAPYLGGVTTTASGILQIVDVAHLLPSEVEALLFQPAMA